MSVSISPPPLMLGQRPTPDHGGTGAPSFRQVPFVRINDRVERGAKVRKSLRRYIEAKRTMEKEMANLMLHDMFIPNTRPDEISKSCLDVVFEKLAQYNKIVGQERFDAVKVLIECAHPLDASSRIKKWNRDLYNQVQKCVQDVQAADKKMERAVIRKEKAEEEFQHWNRIHEANKLTLDIQPTNSECQRALQVAASKLGTANEEHNAACNEYYECQSSLHSAIDRRDELVETASEISQIVEEDRIDTVILVLKQFVASKQRILAAEQMALTELSQSVEEMNRDAAIRQYVVDYMQPELTHRHSRALYVLEWHKKWHLEEQEENDKIQLFLTQGHKPEVTMNDVHVIRDFISHCFISPERSLIPSTISTKHRNRFCSSNALQLYRLESVRYIVLGCLNHQRTHCQELTSNGFEQLAKCLTMILDSCLEFNDYRTGKKILNMSQTFFMTLPTSSSSSSTVYLQKVLLNHSFWTSSSFWGETFQLSIGEELSKSPQLMPWYHLTPTKRSEIVLNVHNVVYGQLSTHILNMAAFGFQKIQIQQFLQHIIFSFELSEDQKINLSFNVDNLPNENIQNGKNKENSAISELDGQEIGYYASSLFNDVRIKEETKSSSTLKKISNSLNPFGRFKGLFDSSSSLVSTNSSSSGSSSSSILNIPSHNSPSVTCMNSTPMSISNITADSCTTMQVKSNGNVSSPLKNSSRTHEYQIISKEETGLSPLELPEAIDIQQTVNQSKTNSTEENRPKDRLNSWEALFGANEIPSNEAENSIDITLVPSKSSNDLLGDEKTSEEVRKSRSRKKSASARNLRSRTSKSPLKRDKSITRKSKSPARNVEQEKTIDCNLMSVASGPGSGSGSTSNSIHNSSNGSSSNSTKQENARDQSIVQNRKSKMKLRKERTRSTLARLEDREKMKKEIEDRQKEEVELWKAEIKASKNLQNQGLQSETPPPSSPPLTSSKSVGAGTNASDGKFLASSLADEFNQMRLTNQDKAILKEKQCNKTCKISSSPLPPPPPDPVLSKSESELTGVAAIRAKFEKAALK